MSAYRRLLRFRLPLVVGRDVAAVQARLAGRGAPGLAADGVYGPRTEAAVRAFQAARGLRVDGLVGERTWHALFAVAPAPDPDLGPLVARLDGWRARPGSCRWRVTRAGVEVEGDPAPLRTPGRPVTVGRIWRAHGAAVADWAERLAVPAELILATIATESGGRADARREEPGFTSWRATPHRISVGLMQTLVSTARETLGRGDLGPDWLAVAENSIRAGTAYIARQRDLTGFDPVLVACAYNAGGLYPQHGAANRWKLRQYPIGTGRHADRFAAWFGDALAVLAAAEAAGEAVPGCSLHRLLP